MLEVKNLKAHYGKALILKGVNLEVRNGETIALLGPNGVGKTTLLKTISGLLTYEGEIKFDGQKLSNKSSHEIVKKGIIHCPENRELFPEMSVEENLRLGAYNRKKEEEDDNLEYVYELFPVLKERKKQMAKTMSGGEQQMVAIGRALMSSPRLLMLDEPSTGLAPKIIDKVKQSLEKIKEDLGIPILLVEQNVHLALEIADRIYIMERGEIKRKGKKEELYEEIEKHYLRF